MALQRKELPPNGDQTVNFGMYLYHVNYCKNSIIQAI